MPNNTIECIEEYIHTVSVRKNIALYKQFLLRIDVVCLFNEKHLMLKYDFYVFGAHSLLDAKIGEHIKSSTESTLLL